MVGAGMVVEVVVDVVVVVDGSDVVVVDVLVDVVVVDAFTMTLPKS